MPFSRFAAEMEESIHHSVNASLITSSRVEENHPHYTVPEATGLRFSDWIVDEACSCATIVFTFWFFVCMIMIMGVYGSVTLILGPHSSMLIKPNSYFVNYVKIEDLYEGTAGPIMLYGLREEPPLDVVLNWSDVHNVNLESNTHKEWTYFLNKGSQISISYSVNSTNSSSNLILLIAKGYDGLNEWIHNPFYPNTSLSWQVIQGNGTIQQDILASSSYYVALGNFNGEAAGVQLSIRLWTVVYNKTEAYVKCTLTRGECSLQLPFGGRNAAVLTSPGPIPGREVNEWYVKLSYGPRWITYLGGIGGMTFLFLAAIHLSCYFACLNGTRRLHIHSVEGDSWTEAAAPLLQNKDDDLSSRGSSYDSLSHDDEDVEDPEGKSAKDSGENNSSTRRLCAICFDAPRDCFFLPCGHCVACFTCGTRIAQASGTCPICRRHMKKVKRIFTV